MELHKTTHGCWYPLKKNDLILISSNPVCRPVFTTLKTKLREIIPHQSKVVRFEGQKSYLLLQSASSRSELSELCTQRSLPTNLGPAGPVECRLRTHVVRWFWGHRDQNIYDILKIISTVEVELDLERIRRSEISSPQIPLGLKES